MTLRFCSAGVPQAIATSSAAVTFNKKVKRHRDWLKLFQAIVLGDHPAVKQSKPAPDSFLVAARRLGTLPETCLVLEDSPAGIKAAKAAGMKVIGYTGGGHADPDLGTRLSRAGADACFADHGAIAQQLATRFG